MLRRRAFLVRRGASFHPLSAVTRSAPHIRDGINLRRVMTYVMLALIPCVLMALYNTGYQANTAMATLGIEAAPGWRGAVLGALRIGYDPSSIWASMWHGLFYVLPLYVVTVMVGNLWQTIFAAWRQREITEGFMVTALLFTLSLPPTVPLWQAALGISFGVVIGQEIFGGIGHNFLNPALAGRAFLYITYPSEMAGDAIWTAVDGFTGATGLSLADTGGMDAIAQQSITWLESFLGRVPGSLGETSTLASLLGAVFLLYTRIVSWRIMAGVLLGMIATVLFFNWVGSSANPMVGMPWYWHLTLGSFAFGTVFLATDPVSAATTDTGRWVYGFLIGFMVVLIRVASFAHPEGVMFAILLGNIFAPLIDHFVMRANIRRRAQRSV
ncbi:MAG: NADH:ubiquinone reductase (Na(+)-transporting) subunit B [Candidatus Tectomicrobia bacterium]|nr:NADH:ubiquinone reductase (Na(+)-transporting) subunit B [Candidatus Tectomicrobia bacterium]